MNERGAEKGRAKVGRVRTSAQPPILLKVSLQPQACGEGPAGPTPGGYQDRSESRILRVLRRAVGGRDVRGGRLVATALGGVGDDPLCDHRLNRPGGDRLAPARLDVEAVVGLQ